MDLESGVSLSPSAMRGWGHSCTKSPWDGGREGEDCVFICWVVSGLWKVGLFSSSFGQDFRLSEKKTHFKGLFEKLTEYPNFSDDIFSYF